MRFANVAGAWRPDLAAPRAAGRGAYLCSQRCAERVRKHKRYLGLAAAAEAVTWAGRPGLSDGGAAVYDSRVPP